MAICYKVTSKNNMSCIVYDLEFGVQYSTKDFVEAPIGGLFVFNTLEDAEKADSTKRSIWECECEEELKDFPLPYMFNKMMFAWERRHYSYSRFYPDGTRLFKRVKLLRRIK